MAEFELNLRGYQRELAAHLGMSINGFIRRASGVDSVGSLIELSKGGISSEDLEKYMIDTIGYLNWRKSGACITFLNEFISKSREEYGKAVSDFVELHKAMIAELNLLGNS